MRIAMTSDIHGHLPKIPDCDLLLIAGDVCPGSEEGPQRRWLASEFAPWMWELRRRGIVVVWIAGNHDVALEADPLPQELRGAGIYLQDSGIAFRGQKIYGSPWSRIILPLAFCLPEVGEEDVIERGGVRGDLETAYSLIPPEVDILVVHGPPLGYGDRAPLDGGAALGGKPGFASGVERVGSPSLLARIDEIKPRLVVCGHIHEDHGVFSRGETTIVNASLLDAKREPGNPPIPLDLPLAPA